MNASKGCDSFHVDYPRGVLHVSLKLSPQEGPGFGHQGNGKQDQVGH